MGYNDYINESYGVRSIDVDAIAKTFSDAGGSYSGDGSEFIAMHDGVEYIDEDKVRFAAQRSADEARWAKQGEDLLLKLTGADVMRYQLDGEYYYDRQPVWFQHRGEVIGKQLIHANPNCPFCSEMLRLGHFENRYEAIRHAVDKMDIPAFHCPACLFNNNDTWSDEIFEMRDNLQAAFKAGRWHYTDYYRKPERTAPPKPTVNYIEPKHLCNEPMERLAASLPSYPYLKRSNLENYSAKKVVVNGAEAFEIHALLAVPKETPKILNQALYIVNIQYYKESISGEEFQRRVGSVKASDFSPHTGDMGTIKLTAIEGKDIESTHCIYRTYTGIVYDAKKKPAIKPGIYMMSLEFGGVKLREDAKYVFFEVNGSKTEVRTDNPKPQKKAYVTVAPKPEPKEPEPKEPTPKEPAPAKSEPLQQKANVTFTQSEAELKAVDSLNTGNKKTDGRQYAAPELSAETAIATLGTSELIRTMRLERFNFYINHKSFSFELFVNTKEPLELGSGIALMCSMSVHVTSKRFLVSKTDYLTPKKGAPALRSFVVEKELPSGYAGQHLYRLRHVVERKDWDTDTKSGLCFASIAVAGVPFLTDIRPFSSEVKIID